MADAAAPAPAAAPLEIRPEEIRERLCRMLGWVNDRFPGAQAVSFVREHLDVLAREDYFVCEKSDGVRCVALRCMAMRVRR